MEPWPFSPTRVTPIEIDPTKGSQPYLRSRNVFAGSPTGCCGMSSGRNGRLIRVEALVFHEQGMKIIFCREKKPKEHVRVLCWQKVTVYSLPVPPLVCTGYPS